MANIFELLGIAPTNDFKIVKKAYLTKAITIHPDKFMQESEQIQKAKDAEFKELSQAYSLVNDPEKLEDYYQKMIAGSTQRFFATPAAPAAPIHRREQAPQDNSFIRMFIPVSFYAHRNSNGVFAGKERAYDPEADAMALRYHRHTDGDFQHEFASHFNFRQLTTVLTNMSKLEHLQVGIDLAEANKIVNQYDKIFSYEMIVEINIPVTYLSQERRPTATYKNTITPRINPSYFLLMAGTLFNEDNIVSVQQAQYFLSSSRCLGESVASDNLWPSTMEQLIHPRYALAAPSAATIDDEAPGLGI